MGLTDKHRSILRGLRMIDDHRCAFLCIGRIQGDPRDSIQCAALYVAVGTTNGGGLRDGTGFGVSTGAGAGGIRGGTNFGISFSCGGSDIATFGWVRLNCTYGQSAIEKKSCS